jgi:hypothetical protein
LLSGGLFAFALGPEVFTEVMVFGVMSRSRCPDDGDNTLYAQFSGQVPDFRNQDALTV